MDPSIWGPHAWFFLHSITLAYPENPTIIDKENMRTFFNAFYKVLPCNTCVMNYTNHIKQLPLTELKRPFESFLLAT